MKIMSSTEFDGYWKTLPAGEDVLAATAMIIAEVRAGGDEAVRRLAARFDKSSPDCFEVRPETVCASWEKLQKTNPTLAGALMVASDHIRRFAEQQRNQLADFEYETADGLIAGQRVIPVQRAAVYVPAGRFPLISSVLMGVIPALVAGVAEVYVASPPVEGGVPDWHITAATYAAGGGKCRIFAIGGAQAIAALALGTETVPRVDVIAGPGNKYVAAAKRLLFGEVGIDFVAGPTDVLIIADENASPELIAADMLAQAEHDPDARARVLVPGQEIAASIKEALERQSSLLSTRKTANASLAAGGLIVVYRTKEEAICITNTIAPEHLELQVQNAESWLPALTNYGALFIGEAAGEVLGDYSVGTNHTLPTAGSSRFTGGLSVRHFLKTVTTLRCVPGAGYEEALRTAEIIAEAEGLAAHAMSAVIRKNESQKK